jgi:predicted nucleic acid-binding protein
MDRRRQRALRLHEGDAHALAEQATLVTANLADMSRVPGLKVEDWALAER